VAAAEAAATGLEVVATGLEVVATGLVEEVVATGLVEEVVGAGIIDLPSLGFQKQKVLHRLSLIIKVPQIFLMHKVILIHKSPTLIRMLLGM